MADRTVRCQTVADRTVRCQTDSAIDASSSDRNSGAGQLRLGKEVRVYCVVKWGQQRLATLSQVKGRNPQGKVTGNPDT